MMAMGGIHSADLPAPNGTVTSTNIKINFLTILVPWPVLNHGGVDFKTMANQTAAKALEEVSLRVISVI